MTPRELVSCMLLADRTVLLVDTDGIALDLIATELKGYGARCFPATDAPTATWGARETLPDVVVCALGLPEFDAAALLGELRLALEATELGAIGLCAYAALDGGRPPWNASETSFQKCLVKPIKTPDLVDAICCVLGGQVLPLPGSSPESELIGAAIARHDYRYLLAALNAATVHRYSAFFRCDGAELSSVWTFDRERPRIDPSEPRLRLGATPCATVVTTQRAFASDDTTRDQRLPTEQRHHAMRAFVGVPLVGLDAVTFGVLCHFDPEPRSSDARTLELLEYTANLFRSERRRRPR